MLTTSGSDDCCAGNVERLSAFIRVPRPGRGRPRKRPDHVVADRGYSYRRCRGLLRRGGIPHTIPERRDQRDRRGRPGRPLRVDAERYRRRQLVERGIARLMRWRGLVTRFEKRAVTYRAVIVVAAIIVWLAD